MSLVKKTQISHLVDQTFVGTLRRSSYKRLDTNRSLRRRVSLRLSLRIVGLVPPVPTGRDSLPTLVSDQRPVARRGRWSGEDSLGKP